MTSDPGVRGRWTTARMRGAALILLAFAAAIVTRADADLWGHLRFGLDILRDRRLSAIDPYSFTQDRPWINHEWLSEAQMAWAYRTGGIPGLLMLKASILVCVFGLVWHALRDVAVGPRITAIVLVAMGTIHMTSSVRPQLWTFLCLAVVCSVLGSARRRLRWALPIVFAFWANCHGGWIVGLGVLGVWALATISVTRGSLLEWTALVLACVVATLVNPYGFGLWSFIAGTVRVGRPIDEWQTLWTTPVLNWLPWAAAVVTTAWLAWRGDRAARPRILCCLVLAAGAARVMRIESLFLMAAGILLAPEVARRWPRQARLRERRLIVPAMVAVLAVSLAVAVGATRHATSCLPIVGPWAPDFVAMTALRQAVPGRIVTPFNWGEYAIWHLSPRLRVSMDGRRETVYSPGRLAEYDDVISGTPRGFAALSTWNAEYVWLPVTSAGSIAWLSGHGYRVDVQTESSAIAVRADLPVLVASPAVTRCFPG